MKNLNDYLNWIDYSSSIENLICWKKMKHYSNDWMKNDLNWIAKMNSDSVRVQERELAPEQVPMVRVPDHLVQVRVQERELVLGQVPMVRVPVRLVAVAEQGVVADSQKNFLQKNCSLAVCNYLIHNLPCTDLLLHLNHISLRASPHNNRHNISLPHLRFRFLHHTHTAKHTLRLPGRMHRIQYVSDND